MFENLNNLTDEEFLNYTYNQYVLYNMTISHDDDEEVGPWIFFVILAAAIVGVFIIVGMCVVSHVVYLKYFKKP